MPFIDELCLNLRAIISDLEPGQVQVFYEAVGYMVSAQADTPTRDGLLMKLMEWPNSMWFDTLEQAQGRVVCISIAILNFSTPCTLCGPL